MLTSRASQLEKRDRLNAKGIDGGSFIPRAIMITGITPNASSMTIGLPRYINFNNFLYAAWMAYGAGYSDIGNSEWMIGTSYKDGINIIYHDDTNIIEIQSMGVSIQSAADGSDDIKFKLTVFYKG